MQMPIPASRALVPYRPFMTVCAAEFDDGSAKIRTYATREACEYDLYAWADDIVGPYELLGWFTPGEGGYIFAAYEHGELRQQCIERPDGGFHFGPWTDEASDPDAPIPF